MSGTLSLGGDLYDVTNGKKIYDGVAGKFEASVMPYEKGDLTSDWASSSYSSGYYDVSGLSVGNVAEGVSYGRSSTGTLLPPLRLMMVWTDGTLQDLGILGSVEILLTGDELYNSAGDLYSLNQDGWVTKNGVILASETQTFDVTEYDVSNGCPGSGDKKTICSVCLKAGEYVVSGDLQNVGYAGGCCEWDQNCACIDNSGSNYWRERSVTCEKRGNRLYSSL